VLTPACICLIWFFVLYVLVWLRLRLRIDIYVFSNSLNYTLEDSLCTIGKPCMLPFRV